jgi:hypothetical protein
MECADDTIDVAKKKKSECERFQKVGRLNASCPILHIGAALTD